MKNVTLDRKQRRKRRISKGIFGTKEKPRISVFRSNQYIYAQAVDDGSRTTLASVSSVSKRNEEQGKKTKTEEAKQAGLFLAKALIAKHIETGVFDRGMYAYNGRVKALAEGLREGGLKI
jgi:large subunit ribosomal protein L18